MPSAFSVHTSESPRFKKIKKAEFFFKSTPANSDLIFKSAKQSFLILPLKPASPPSQLIQHQGETGGGL
jgi:hypothetical protein